MSAFICRSHDQGFQTPRSVRIRTRILHTKPNLVLHVFASTLHIETETGGIGFVQVDGNISFFTSL